MRFILPLLILTTGLTFSQQTINGSISHDGQQRTYILYVPASYNANTNVPLVFNLHGYTSNANDQMIYGDFRSIADTANFLVVHPMGLTDNSNITHWNVENGNSSVDDLGFINALLDELIANYAIDTNRVYSTGMSNGGYMSFYLACKASNRFAAVASVTGAMSQLNINNCNRQHPTPVMQIHGTNDNTVPYNGAPPFVPSVPDVVDFWVSENNCSTTPIQTTLPNTNTFDGSTVEHYVYTGGDLGSTVEHYKVIGGGHTWPGSAVVLSGTNYDFDASVEIWRFFSKYNLADLKQTTSVNELAQTEFKVFPNPTQNGLVNIRLFNEVNQATLFVYNTIGKEVLTRKIKGSNTSISLENEKPGVYFFKVNEQVIKVIKQ